MKFIFKFLVLFVLFQSISGLLKSIIHHKILKSTKISFFYGTSFLDNTTYPLDDASNVLKHPRFSCEKKTILYIHGWKGSALGEDSRAIIGVYQSRADHNILILNWNRVSDGSYYLNAVPNTFKYSLILADGILKMISNGLDIKSLHVIGNALGGQLAGLLGKKIQMKSDYKLKRITALDPSGPIFYPCILKMHLTNDDAEMVDVIHTDAGGNGAPVSTGTIDFWPNSGKSPQPGCPEKRSISLLLQTEDDRCSEIRAWRYYVESVAFKKSKFLSTKCSSWDKYASGACDFGIKIPMGIDCPKTASGDYYLVTNSMAPFSRWEIQSVNIKSKALKSFSNSLLSETLESYESSSSSEENITSVDRNTRRESRKQRKLERRQNRKDRKKARKNETSSENDKSKRERKLERRQNRKDRKKARRQERHENKKNSKNDKSKIERKLERRQESKRSRRHIAINVKHNVEILRHDRTKNDKAVKKFLRALSPLKKAVDLKHSVKTHVKQNKVSKVNSHRESKKTRKLEHRQNRKERKESKRSRRNVFNNVKHTVELLGEDFKDTKDRIKNIKSVNNVLKAFSPVEHVKKGLQLTQSVRRLASNRHRRNTEESEDVDKIRAQFFESFFRDTKCNNDSKSSSEKSEKGENNLVKENTEIRKFNKVKKTDSESTANNKSNKVNRTKIDQNKNEDDAKRKDTNKQRIFKAKKSKQTKNQTQKKSSNVDESNNSAERVYDFEKSVESTDQEIDDFDRKSNIANRRIDKFSNELDENNDNDQQEWRRKDQWKNQEQDNKKSGKFQDRKDKSSSSNDSVSVLAKLLNRDRNSSNDSTLGAKLWEKFLLLGSRLRSRIHKNIVEARHTVRGRVESALYDQKERIKDALLGNRN